MTVPATHHLYDAFSGETSRPTRSRRRDGAGKDACPEVVDAATETPSLTVKSKAGGKAMNFLLAQ
jgi:hypothetical protein